jgi:hypothetical protein
MQPTAQPVISRKSAVIVVLGDVAEPTRRDVTDNDEWLLPRRPQADRK